MISCLRRALIFAGVLIVLAVTQELFAQVHEQPGRETNDTGKPATVLNDEESRNPKRAKLLAGIHQMLALSREIKADMAKNGPDTLSLETVRKVEELQKLAATVKAEMGKVQ